MNERIRELAEQARDYVADAIELGYPQDQVDDIRDEKFAELIVRECVDIADEQKKWVEDMEVFNERDATWNKARIQQSQRIVDKIKEHFGVE